MKRLVFVFFAFSLFAEQKLYIGPDLFYRYYNELIEGGGKSTEMGWIPGFQAGWDFYRGWVPYVGADIRFAEGRTRFDGTVVNVFQRTFAPFQSHTDNTLFNVEGRLGYTLKWKSVRLSPFFGMGYQRWMREAVDRTSGYDELYTWGYLAEGIRLNWDYCKWGAVGLNLKMMQMKMSEIQIRGAYSWPIVLNLGNKWQAEAEIPLSWNPLPYGISLVSYFRYLPIGKSQEQRTSRGIIFEPASVTYVSGARLEFAYDF